MKSIIIFGSQYGSAKQYAERLSKRINLDCLAYQEVHPEKKYDVIIYIGSLYAGGVVGLSKTLKQYPMTMYCAKLFIVTVGIADPNDMKNMNTIRHSVYKQLPKNFDSDIELFHIRGRLNYSKLNLKHKLMMKLVYQRAKKVPIEEQSEETKALITTYNKKVDFVDFHSLDKIVKRFSQISNIRNEYSI